MLRAKKGGKYIVLQADADFKTLNSFIMILHLYIVLQADADLMTLN